MTVASPTPPVTPVLVDTMLAGHIFARSSSQLLRRYRRHLIGHPIVLSFVSVMELRYGAYKAGWGEGNLELLERGIREVRAVVMPDDELVELCARLRAQCERAGHALHAKVHDADRWIAATAIRYGLPLVSDDGIYQGLPGLLLRREPP